MPGIPRTASDRPLAAAAYAVLLTLVASMAAAAADPPLDALQQAGVADKTLLIFSSDNGPWFGGSPTNIRKKSAG